MRSSGVWHYGAAPKRIVLVMRSLPAEGLPVPTIQEPWFLKVSEACSEVL